MADRSVNKDVEDFQSNSPEKTHRSDSGIDLQRCFRISELQDGYEKNLVGIGSVVQMSSIGLMGGVATGNLSTAAAVIAIGPIFFGWQIKKSNSAKRRFLALRCDEIPLEDLTSASFIAE